MGKWVEVFEDSWTYMEYVVSGRPLMVMEI